MITKSNKLNPQIDRIKKNHNKSSIYLKQEIFVSYHSKKTKLLASVCVVKHRCHFEKKASLSI